MTDLFTADLHLYHQNITQASKRELKPYFNRPFADVDEMHAAIVADWNSRVRPTDRVFILGDLSFTKAANTLELLAKLNGQIFLVKGNHDSSREMAALSKKLAWVRDYHEQFFESVGHGRVRVCLFHFPILSWSCQSHGAWHFHGHSHGNLVLPEALKNSRMVDVGIDATHKWTGHWGPVSLDEILDAHAANAIPVAMESHRNLVGDQPQKDSGGGWLNKLYNKFRHKK